MLFQRNFKFLVIIFDIYINNNYGTGDVGSTGENCYYPSIKNKSEESRDEVDLKPFSINDKIYNDEYMDLTKSTLEKDKKIGLTGKSDTCMIENDIESVNIKNNKYSKGFVHLLALSRNGNALAQYNLANRYAEGVGVFKNRDEAVKWYHHASNNGNSKAQQSLADFYFGEGEMKKALEWYIRAKNQGGIKSSVLLKIAECYEGLEDVIEAIKWYQQSAESGDPVAQEKLADYYEDGTYVPQDKSRAEEWRKMSVQSGPLDMKKCLLNDAADFTSTFKDRIDLKLNTELCRGCFDGDVRISSLLNEKNVNEADLDGFTLIFYAIANNQKRVVEILISREAKLDQNDNVLKVAPLSSALVMGNAEIVQLILAADNCGVNIGSAPENPVNLALLAGMYQVIPKMLQLGADVSSIDSRLLWSSVFEPVDYQHVLLLKTLLENKIVKVDQKVEFFDENFNAFPIHIASTAGSIEIVELLLRHKADPNIPAEDGDTALHMATKMNKVSVVNCLLSNGANLNAVDEHNGATALHYAAGNGNVEVVQLLHEYKADIHQIDLYGQTGLHRAIELERLPVMECLLSNGANVNVADNEGNSALHIAAMVGNSEAVQLLLEYKADIHQVDFYGQTALHLAIEKRDLRRSLQVMNCLLSNGANPNVTDDDGVSPLATATFLCSQDPDAAVIRLLTDVIKLLMKYNADVNIIPKSWRGNTLLHIAIAGNVCEEIFKLLLQNNSTLNLTNQAAGNTALHVAAYSRNLQLTKLLLEHGAIVDPVNARGCTPLHFAAHEGDLEIVNFLLKHYANCSTLDTSGVTPVDVAKFTRNVEIQNVLQKSLKWTAKGLEALPKYDESSPDYLIEEAIAAMKLAKISVEEKTAVARGFEAKMKSVETVGRKY